THTHTHTHKRTHTHTHTHPTPAGLRDSPEETSSREPSSTRISRALSFIAVFILTGDCKQRERRCWILDPREELLDSGSERGAVLGEMTESLVIYTV
ncbi:hypothetical protein ANANG_G00102880, partial [Anguilla anguilla]